MAPLAATHWRPIGPTGWSVRFYEIDGSAWPLHDHHALAQCLELRAKHVRAAGAKGVRRVDAFNKNGEVRPAWIAPPAAAAALIAKARELGRPGVNEVEADFAAAFHGTMAMMAKEVA